MFECFRLQCPKVLQGICCIIMLFARCWASLGASFSFRGCQCDWAPSHAILLQKISHAEFSTDCFNWKIPEASWSCVHFAGSRPMGKTNGKALVNCRPESCSNCNTEARGVAGTRKVWESRFWQANDHDSSRLFRTHATSTAHHCEVFCLRLPRRPLRINKFGKRFHFLALAGRSQAAYENHSTIRALFLKKGL